MQRDRGGQPKLAANAAAAAFYAGAAAARRLARQYLTERSAFDAAARKFGCGFAPMVDSLTKHLQRKVREPGGRGTVPAGPARPGGPVYRRLLWRPHLGRRGGRVRCPATVRRRRWRPRSTSARPRHCWPQEVIGDVRHRLAKRDIAKDQAVIVEGYTDVMATCCIWPGSPPRWRRAGPHFGGEHLAMLRRLMMNDSFFRGELITFSTATRPARRRAQDLRR